jgi:hypothetical protein
MLNANTKSLFYSVVKAIPYDLYKFESLPEAAKSVLQHYRVGQYYNMSGLMQLEQQGWELTLSGKVPFSVQ